MENPTGFGRPGVIGALNGFQSWAPCGKSMGLGGSYIWVGQGEVEPQTLDNFLCRSRMFFVCLFVVLGCAVWLVGT